MASQPSFYYKIIAHVVGWTIFFFLPILLSPHPEITTYLSEPDIILSLVIRTVLLMALFYTNLFYFTPVVLQKNGIIFFSIVITILIFMISFANWQLHEFLTDPFDNFRQRLEPRSPDEFNFGPPKTGLMIAGPFFFSFLITLIVSTVS